jgi:voltage-gated potassium channel
MHLEETRMHSFRRIIISVTVLLLLIVTGTAGYMTIEGWPLLDSLYMTITTVATVGFGEVHPLSNGARIFTLFLIITGVSVFFYLVGSVAQIMFEGQIQQLIGRKKVEKKIDALSGHYIICGFGRIGSMICRELAGNGVPFVVVEHDTEVIERMEDDRYLYLKGDATLDDTLVRAGILRATGLISVVTSDSENVYITLTARGLNQNLYILARSGEEGTELKLKRAGANKVVSPYTIGGMRMAQSILRPNVVDFIEIATGSEHMDLQMEEVTIPADSAFAGATLVSSGFRKETGVIIVGIKKTHGQMIFNPNSHAKIDGGDTLIILGDPGAVDKLEGLVKGKAGATLARGSSGNHA